MCSSFPLSISEKMVHTLSLDEVFVTYEHDGKIHTILACKTSGT